MVPSEALRRGVDMPEVRSMCHPNAHVRSACARSLPGQCQADCSGRRQREGRLGDSLGVLLGGLSREIRVKPYQAWRLSCALRELVTQRRCSGKALQVVMEYVINHFMVQQHGGRQTDSGAKLENSDPRFWRSCGLRPASFL